MKFALPFIIIAISVGLYFVYISPTIADIQALSEKKVEYNSALIGAGELKAKRDAVLADYNNISADNIDKLDKIIPATFNSVIFANDVNSIASRYGLSVKDFKIDPNKTDLRDAIINQAQDQLYKTTDVTFTVEGQYTQFLQFLSDVESGLRVVDVTSLSVKNLGGQTSPNSPMEFLLEMNAYSLR